MELDAVSGGVFNFDNIIAQVNLANQNAMRAVSEIIFGKPVDAARCWRSANQRQNITITPIDHNIPSQSFMTPQPLDRAVVPAATGSVSRSIPSCRMDLE